MAGLAWALLVPFGDAACGDRVCHDGGDDMRCVRG